MQAASFHPKITFNDAPLKTDEKENNKFSQEVEAEYAGKRYIITLFFTNKPNKEEITKNARDIAGKMVAIATAFLGKNTESVTLFKPFSNDPIIKKTISEQKKNKLGKDPIALSEALDSRQLAIAEKRDAKKTKEKVEKYKAIASAIDFLQPKPPKPIPSLLNGAAIKPKTVNEVSIL